MHATKSFAVGEAGLIYSADPDRIATLRTMSSFGFGEPRSATMPGLNAKLSEVSALLGRLRLTDYDCITAHRATLLNRYRAALPELDFQQVAPGIQAHQFVPALLPSALSGRRPAIRAELENRGITTGAYFSPHLLEQPYFRKVCPATPVPVCDDVSARMISLPLYDTMTPHEVDYVVESLRSVISDMEPLSPSRGEHHAPMVYAGASYAGAQVNAK
jgi:dTDP-4-amino-4,6-dideoxygalactose transaminase